MDKIKIVFFGTPQFVTSVLDKLQQNFQVVGVVTAPDKPVGRKQILTPSPVKTWAFKQNIPVLTPQKIDPQTHTKLQTLDPDLFVVAAFGKIIPQNILDIPKFGSLNVHPSLLPKYRGPSPIQTAILNGDQTSGITIIKMDSQIDHGPILFTKEIRLSDQDTFDNLSTKIFEEAAEIMVRIIPDFIQGKINPLLQDDAIASYCHIITKEDGYFDITNPPSPEKLDRMIRAYYPWPTAWSRWNNKIIKLLPGKMIQMEGKKPVKLEDFLRGYPDFPIKTLLN